MKKNILVLMVLTLVIFTGCNRSDTTTTEKAERAQAVEGEAKILQAWQGDYPVTQLNMLPEKQRENSVGYVDDAKTFEGIWKGFKPGEEVPEIDFTASMVIFARNTQFFNRIRIGRVNVTNGVAEVLAMETMSAMPIEDNVFISLVVVGRQGITALQIGNEITPVNER